MPNMRTFKSIDTFGVFIIIIIQVSLAWLAQLTQSALYQFSDVEQIVRLPHVDSALPYHSLVLFYKNVLEQGVQNTVEHIVLPNLSQFGSRLLTAGAASSLLPPL